MTTYNNFELRIRPAGPDGLYPIEASTHAGAKATGAMPAPLAAEELATLLARAESGEATQAELAGVGRRLRELVFTQPIAVLVGQGLGANAGLRLRLWIDAPELAALPWEFLQSPVEADRFLALTPRIAIARYLPAGQAADALAVSGTLNVVIAGAGPADLPPLDIAGTVARVQKALAGQAEKISLRVIEHTTPELLQDALLAGDVHVLHFAGHGFYNAETRQGMLAFENEDGSANWVAAEPLSYLLADTSVRLVYLDACQTGQAGGPEPASDAQAGRPGLGVAQALLTAGVPAVIAMRFAIPDGSARKFAGKFYAALAAGQPVDAALAEGRRAVMLDGALRWGTPMLFMRAPTGELFTRTPPAVPARSGDDDDDDDDGGDVSVQVGNISGVTGSQIQIGAGNLSMEENQ